MAGVNVEWTHLLAEKTPLNGLKVPLGSSARLKYTCLSVSKKYIALGSNTGSVYIFNRTTLKHLQILFPDTESAYVNIVSLGPSDRVLAFSTVNGHVMVMELNIDRGHKPERLRLITDHVKCNVTCLQWDDASSRLYVGDNMGRVTVSMIPNSKMKNLVVLPVDVIMRLESSVVQLDWCYDKLLVSTLNKTYLCNTERQNFTQVGKKPRDGLYGGCFFQPHKSRLPKIYCARPSSRMWEVDFEGGVLNTHQFKQLLAVPPLQVITASDEGWEPPVNQEYSPQGINFPKLKVIGGNYLLTWNKDRLYVFDPVSVKVILWCTVVTDISDICCHGNSTYIYFENGHVMHLELLPISSFVSYLISTKKTILVVDILSYFMPSVLKTKWQKHMNISDLHQLHGYLLDAKRQDLADKLKCILVEFESQLDEISDVEDSGSCRSRSDSSTSVMSSDSKISQVSSEKSLDNLDVTHGRGGQSIQEKEVKVTLKDVNVKSDVTSDKSSAVDVRGAVMDRNRNSDNTSYQFSRGDGDVTVIGIGANIDGTNDNSDDNKVIATDMNVDTNDTEFDGVDHKVTERDMNVDTKDRSINSKAKVTVDSDLGPVADKLLADSEILSSDSISALNEIEGHDISVCKVSDNMQDISSSDSRSNLNMNSQEVSPNENKDEEKSENKNEESNSRKIFCVGDAEINFESNLENENERTMVDSQESDKVKARIDTSIDDKRKIDRKTETFVDQDKSAKNPQIMAKYVDIYSDDIFSESTDVSCQPTSVCQPLNEVTFDEELKQENDQEPLIQKSNITTQIPRSERKIKVANVDISSQGVEKPKKAKKVKLSTSGRRKSTGSVKTTHKRDLRKQSSTELMIDEGTDLNLDSPVTGRDNGSLPVIPVTGTDNGSLPEIHSTSVSISKVHSESELTSVKHVHSSRSGINKTLSSADLASSPATSLSVSPSMSASSSLSASPLSSSWETNDPAYNRKLHSVKDSIQSKFSSTKKLLLKTLKESHKTLRSFSREEQGVEQINQYKDQKFEKENLSLARGIHSDTKVDVKNVVCTPPVDLTDLTKVTEDLQNRLQNIYLLCDQDKINSALKSWIAELNRTLQCLHTKQFQQHIRDHHQFKCSSATSKVPSKKMDFTDCSSATSKVPPKKMDCTDSEFVSCTDIDLEKNENSINLENNSLDNFQVRDGKTNLIGQISSNHDNQEIDQIVATSSSCGNSEVLDQSDDQSSMTETSKHKQYSSESDTKITMETVPEETDETVVVKSSSQEIHKNGSTLVSSMDFTDKHYITDPFCLSSKLHTEVSLLTKICLASSCYGNISEYVIPNVSLPNDLCACEGCMLESNKIQERSTSHNQHLDQSSNSSEGLFDSPTHVRPTSCQISSDPCQSCRTSQSTSTSSDHCLFIKLYFHLLDIHYLREILYDNQEDCLSLWSTMVRIQQELCAGDLLSLKLDNNEIKSAVDLLSSKSYPPERILGYISRLFVLSPSKTIDLCIECIHVKPIDVLYLCTYYRKSLQHYFYKYMYNRVQDALLDKRKEWRFDLYGNKLVLTKWLELLLSHQNNSQQLSQQSPIPHTSLQKQLVTLNNQEMLDHVISVGVDVCGDELLQICKSSGYWFGCLKILKSQKKFTEYAELVLQLKDIHLLDDKLQYGYLPATIDEWENFLQLFHDNNTKQVCCEPSDNKDGNRDNQIDNVTLTLAEEDNQEINVTLTYTEGYQQGDNTTLTPAKGDYGGDDMNLTSSLIQKHQEDNMVTLTRTEGDQKVDMTLTHAKEEPVVYLKDLISLMLSHLGTVKTTDILLQYDVEISCVLNKLLESSLFSAYINKQQMNVIHNVIEKLDTYLWTQKSMCLMSKLQFAVTKEKQSKNSQIKDEESSSIIHGLSGSTASATKFIEDSECHWGTSTKLNKNCKCCNLPLTETISHVEPGILVFLCGHSFHRVCLFNKECLICQFDNGDAKF